LVTYVLLYSFSPVVYEANPVAQWFFVRWNIFGMTIFKFGLVALVIVLSEVLERRRPGLGKVVMVFACVAAGAVVCQGLQIFSDLGLGALEGSRARSLKAFVNLRNPATERNARSNLHQCIRIKRTASELARSASFGTVSTRQRWPNARS